MLNTIIGFSIRNKAMVGLALLVLLFIGIYQLKKLPIDALPDITSNQVQVITVSPALAAPEVERLITFNVEQSCANIPGIQELRSISRFGLSVVTIVFNDQTDIYWARQQVSERMPYIKGMIPDGAGSPELAPLTTGLGEVYQYFLETKPGYEEKYSLAELRSMQDWIVRRQLLGTPGIADVSSFGGYLKQYEVSVNPDKLKAMNLSIADIFKALEENNQNSGGSYIEKGPTAQFIRTEGLAKSMSDIEQIPVKLTQNGLPVLIRDIAAVREGKANRYGALVYEDKGEVAGAVVLMLKGSNAYAVVHSIKEKLAKIQEGLPEGVHITPFYDRTKVVDRALNTVSTNLAEGALIVIFMLVIFLGNIRAGLIVASVIPLAMLFAVIMMNLFGVSGNLMSLGALDFGLIVDGAVIIVEAVLHKMHHPSRDGQFTRLTQGEMDYHVEESAGKMMNAAVFGQVIILIVYLPILTLAGIEGKMFGPMAQTVAFALVGAFILSLTYVPMVTALFLNKKWKGKPNLSDHFVNKLRSIYRPLLQKSLSKPVYILSGALALFVFSVWLLLTLGGEFIPELEEGDFAVDTRMLAGTSLSHTIEVAQEVNYALKSKFPEVERIVTRIGSSEIPTDPMPMEMSDVIILLKPKDEWTSARSYDELADKMSEVLADFPGLTAGFQFPIQMRFNELISGARQDVVCKLFGENLDTLTLYASKLSNAVNGVKGLNDLYIETVTGLPQIQVVYDRRAMSRYGVSIADVNKVVETAFAGSGAGLVYENERRFDLVVRLEEADRRDIKSISELLIPVAGGTQVPLYLLANISVEDGPNQIQRENAQRRIVVSFNVRGRDVESVVKDVQKNIKSQVQLPPGYFLTYGGAFENLQEARQRLGIAVPIALLLIFFLLYLAFGQVGPGLIIFTAIPLSAIGGILALWFRGMPFSISAGIGFIALFGVSVLNGIVLITEIRKLYLETGKSLMDSIMEGCISRLRPVLMTAAVASFGFLPMALSQRAGAEVQRPLATVVIAGLVSSTLLTLFVLPILYQWMEKRRIKMKKIIPVLLVLLLPVFGSAQNAEGFTFQQALDFVEINHPAMAAHLMQSEYRQAMQESAKSMPKTFVGLDAGQNQGPYFDILFLARQSFQPMGFSRKQADLFQSSYEQSQIQLTLTKKEIKLGIGKLYQDYFAAKQSILVIGRMDSLLKKARLLSEKRLQQGETDRFELMNIAQMSGRLNQELLGMQKWQKFLRVQLGILLMKNGEAEPIGEWSLTPQAPVLADSTQLFQHPSIVLKMKDVELASKTLEAEKAFNRPYWEVGVSSISVTGWHTAKDGNSEKYYNMGNRLFSAAVGLNFPLFNRGTKAKIAAMSFLEREAEEKVKVEWQQLKIQNEQLISEWIKLKDQMDYFEKEALPRSEWIIETAEKKFSTGSIDYLQWSMIVQQELQTRLQAIDARKLLEIKMIELQYINESL